MEYKEITDDTMGSNMLHEPVAISSHSDFQNVQPMPCTYTDEEFEQILQEAEKGPYVSDDVVKQMFASWL